MKPRTIGVASAILLGIVLVALGLSAYNRSGSATTVSNVPALASYASAFSKPQVERVMTPQQTSTYPYASTIWYYLNLNKDCSTYTSDLFIYDLTRTGGVFGNTTVNRDRIDVLNIICGSMTVFFRCKSALSAADADQLCTNIVTAAQNKDNTLNRIAQGLTWTTQPDIYNDDGTSNNGIYALYTLILLPIFCVAGFMGWYRHKATQADSQYLQDTATFANVASRAPVPQQPYDPTPAQVVVPMVPAAPVAPQMMYPAAQMPTPTYYPTYTTYAAPPVQPAVYPGGFYAPQQ